MRQFLDARYCEHCDYKTVLSRSVSEPTTWGVVGHQRGEMVIAVSFKTYKEAWGEFKAVHARHDACPPKSR